MTETCARCGRASSPTATACEFCAAVAARPAAPRWGTLDIKREDLPPRRPRSSPLSGALQVAQDELREALTDCLPEPPASAVASAAKPAKPRGPSGPLARQGSGPQHLALRGSAPQAIGAQAARGSAPQAVAAAARAATPQHPAARGSSPRQPAVRVRAASAALAEMQVANVAPDEVPGFDDRFSDTQLELGPTLDIEAPVLRHAPAPANLNALAQPRSEAPAAPSARLAQVSGYGTPPQRLLQTVPYFFHVVARKRALRAQLSAQALQRKRTEQKAEDAQCALGEAIYAQREHPRLAPLATQLRIVSEARERITSNTASGKRVARAHKRELQALTQRAEQLKASALPCDQQASELGVRIASDKAQIRDLEHRTRKLESEQKSLKGSSQVASLERIAAVELEREAVRAQVDALHAALAPLVLELAGVKREIAQHMDALALLDEQRQKIIETSERDGDRQRIASGSAVSAYRDALRSLANAAARNGLRDLTAPAAAMTSTADAPIADERHSEALLRKALESYDVAAYRRGMQLLAGGILGTFVFFLMLIAL